MNRSSAVTRAALALSMGLLAAGAASAQTMVNARVLSSTPVWEQVPVSDCRGAYPGAVRPSGPGTAVGIREAVERVEAHALPELIAAGAGDLLHRLLLQHAETTLQVFGLRNTHQNSAAGAITTLDRTDEPGRPQKGSFFLASLSRSASISRRRFRIVS